MLPFFAQKADFINMSNNVGKFSSLKNSGLWETLANGDRIWRLGIISKGAVSLKLNFGEYEIPEGSRLFVYNKDTSITVGAFTSRNNSFSKNLSLSPISGEEIILEYDEPYNVSGLGELALGLVCHTYRRPSISGTSTDGTMSSSGSCEVDINCPEGANWQNHKHAVCKIYYMAEDSLYYNCTGSLVNNTNLQKQYAWLGFHARRANQFAYLDEIQSLMQRDASVTVDLFAYDFDEPYLLLAVRGIRPQVEGVLDNAPLHTKQGVS